MRHATFVPLGLLLALVLAGISPETNAQALTGEVDELNAEAQGARAITLTCGSSAPSYPQGSTATFTYEICDTTGAGGTGVVIYEVLQSSDGVRVVSPTLVRLGTLPAGGCSGTQSFSVNVPPSAPAVGYDVVISGIGDAGNLSCVVPITVTTSSRPAGSATTWSLVEATAWPSFNADATTGAAEVTAFPNPLERMGTLSFGLAEGADVRLTVYDALGREVAVLAEGAFEAGPHAATFDASGLPAGVYVYRLAVDGTVQTGRMTVVR